VSISRESNKKNGRYSGKAKKGKLRRMKEKTTKSTQGKRLGPAWVVEPEEGES